MKKLLIFGLVLLISIFGIMGCSDDDVCPVCPQIAQEGAATFYVGINRGEFRCYGLIYGIDGKIITPDSVKIENYTMEIMSSFEEGMGTYCRYSEETQTSYNIGDLVELNIYMPNGITTGTVALLEDSINDPSVYDWGLEYPYDTVALGTEVTIAWASQSGVDFYGLNWSYEHDYNGEYRDITELISTTDTSVVIPASTLAYNGRLYIDVFAVTGPAPDANGNLTGGVLKGKINSMASDYFTIYVGNGNSGGGGPMVKGEDQHTPLTFEDFLF